MYVHVLTERTNVSVPYLRSMRHASSVHIKALEAMIQCAVLIITRAR